MNENQTDNETTNTRCPHCAKEMTFSDMDGLYVKTDDVSYNQAVMSFRFSSGDISITGECPSCKNRFELYYTEQTGTSEMRKYPQE